MTDQKQHEEAMRQNIGENARSGGIADPDSLTEENVDAYDHTKVEQESMYPKEPKEDPSVALTEDDSDGKTEGKDSKNGQSSKQAKSQ